MRKRLTDNKRLEISKFLYDNVNPKASEEFQKAAEAGRDVEWLSKKWDKLTQSDLWNEKYQSRDFLETPTVSLEKVYNNMPEGLSEAKMNEFVEKYDLTPEMIIGYYNYRNDQKEALDKFNESRYADASKEYKEIKRSKDASYFNTPLANEYAREAYIKGNPNAALAHEVVGKVAGLADFAPFPASLVGTALRTGQKAVTGRDLLTLNTALDVGGAIVPDFAEKPAKFMYDYGKSLIERAIPKLGDTKIMKSLENKVNAKDASELSKATEKELSVMRTDLTKLSDRELLDLYNKTDNPIIKSSIEEYSKAKSAKNVLPNIPDDVVRENKAAIIAEEKKIDDRIAEANAKFIKSSADDLARVELAGRINKVEPYDAAGNLNPYFSKVPMKELSEYVADKEVENSLVANALATGLNYGGRKIARSMPRATGWNYFDPEPKDNTDKIIKTVIDIKKDEWSKMDHEPKEYYTDPLIREAYDKWKEDIIHRPFNEEEYVK